jgi:hypothetical protein
MPASSGEAIRLFKIWHAKSDPHPTYDQARLWLIEIGVMPLSRVGNAESGVAAL